MPPKTHVPKLPPPIHETGDKVLCFHGPLLYEAKVLEINPAGSISESPSYKVHYKGWKSSWDEWVPQDRVLKWSDENLGVQKQLREEHAPPKKAKAEKGAPKGTKAQSEEAVAPQLRGQKRAREMDMDKEEDFIKRHEVKLPIPEAIKSRLVDDWEYVTKGGTLVHLPRDPSVSQLLDDYLALYPTLPQPPKPSPEGVIDEVISGLKIYFNRCLGTMLLYRFEREQYADARTRWPEKEMCELYGAEHLARLFVSMPELIAHTNMDQQAVTLLRQHIDGILNYLAKNEDTLFMKEYEHPGPTYNTTSS